MKCACRSVILRQVETAFIKAISSFQVSPALLKELRLAMARWKKPAVPAGRRSTSSGRTSASQQLAGKQKANETASSSDSTEPANRRPAPGAGSLPLPANPAVTGEQATSGSRQPGPPGVGATYAAVLSGSVAPSQPSGTLKPTAMDSDSSKSGVLMETSERRMFQDMSGTLCHNPDGTTIHAHVANACLPAGQRLDKTRFLFQGLVTLVSSWPDCGHPALAV